MNAEQTFFNVITLPADKVEESLKAWKAVGCYMEKQESFLGSRLYKNQRNPLMLINQGKYSNAEAFMASIQTEESQALSQVLTNLGVERVDGLYDATHTFGDAEENL